MTPFEAKGWTEDMKFKVVKYRGKNGISDGDTVWIECDDGTNCPWFTNGETKGAIYVDDIEPIVEEPWASQPNNKELLDWAVKNIKEWEGEWTHVRSDETGMFYTSGEWSAHKGYPWRRDKVTGDFKWINRERLPLQAITKEEWEIAKGNPVETINGQTGNVTIKNFTKADLKTGMILEFENGKLVMVLRGTANGDIVSGDTWCPLMWSSIPELGAKSLSSTRGGIVRVYQPDTNRGYLNSGLHKNHPVIWELNAEKKEAIKKKIEEQQAVLDKLKRELRNYHNGN